MSQIEKNTQLTGINIKVCRDNELSHLCGTSDTSPQFELNRTMKSRSVFSMEFEATLLGFETCSILNKHEVSRFGFHGSIKENWYSILRNWLRCLTDTNLMTIGKIKGEGIYVADTLELATMYAHYTMNIYAGPCSLI